VVVGHRVFPDGSAWVGARGRRKRHIEGRAAGVAAPGALRGAAGRWQYARGANQSWYRREWGSGGKRVCVRGQGAGQSVRARGTGVKCAQVWWCAVVLQCA